MWRRKILTGVVVDQLENYEVIAIDDGKEYEDDVEDGIQANNRKRQPQDEFHDFETNLFVKK